MGMKTRRAFVASGLVAIVVSSLAVVDAAPPAGMTQTVVNNGSDYQTDSHISGTLVSYTANDNGQDFIHYQDLSSGVDAIIPNNLSDDFLSDVSGNAIVFTRVKGTSSIYGPRKQLDRDRSRWRRRHAERRGRRRCRLERAAELPGADGGGQCPRRNSRPGKAQQHGRLGVRNRDVLERRLRLLGQRRGRDLSRIDDGTTNAAGDATFTATLLAVPAGQLVTATATGASGTSEFSACKQVKDANGLIADLGGTVQGLPGLNAGQKNALTAKLQAALNSIASGNTTQSSRRLHQPGAGAAGQRHFATRGRSPRRSRHADPAVARLPMTIEWRTMCGFAPTEPCRDAHRKTLGITEAGHLALPDRTRPFREGS
jgi:hypothetical protein